MYSCKGPEFVELSIGYEALLIVVSYGEIPVVVCGVACVSFLVVGRAQVDCESEIGYCWAWARWSYERLEDGAFPLYGELDFFVLPHVVDINEV